MHCLRARVSFAINVATERSALKSTKPFPHLHHTPTQQHKALTLTRSNDHNASCQHSTHPSV